MKTSPSLTPEYLESLGHKRMSPLKAIRARCLDCCVFQSKEVTLCAHKKCPSWPFRMGKNPWTAANLTRGHGFDTPTTTPPRPREKTPAPAGGNSPEGTFKAEPSK